jgi:hypothetical protein
MTNCSELIERTTIGSQVINICHVQLPLNDYVKAEVEIHSPTPLLYQPVTHL